MNIYCHECTREGGLKEGNVYPDTVEDVKRIVNESANSGYTTAIAQCRAVVAMLDPHKRLPAPTIKRNNEGKVIALSVRD